MRLTRDKYDRLYYDSPFFRTTPDSQRNRLRLNEILAHKAGGKLLEVGCGRGDFLTLAAARFQVEGIDDSEYAVSQAHPTVRANVSKVDIEDQFPDGYYDVIVAFNVLEHLKAPDLAIQKIHQRLAPCGMVFGSVPHNAHLVGSVYTWITNYFDKTHCSTYAPDHWHKLFQEAGFSEIRLFGEVALGPNMAIYIQSAYWRNILLNLMFECRK